MIRQSVVHTETRRQTPSPSPRLRHSPSPCPPSRSPQHRAGCYGGWRSVQCPSTYAQHKRGLCRGCCSVFGAARNQRRQPDGRGLRRYHGILATLREVVCRSGPGVGPFVSSGHYPMRYALHRVLLVDVLPDEGKRESGLVPLAADHAFSTDIPVTDLCGGRGSQTGWIWGTPTLRARSWQK